MKRFPIIAGLITMLIIVGGVFMFSKKSSSEESAPPPNPTGYEYFGGQGCPHCANVEEYQSTWENKDRIEIEKKDVYNNPTNAQLMRQRANSCELPFNQIGVPFLFTPEGECIIGDTPIINFFKSLF
jgi:glutaredoxin